MKNWEVEKQRAIEGIKDLTREIRVRVPALGSWPKLPPLRISPYSLKSVGSLYLPHTHY